MDDWKHDVLVSHQRHGHTLAFDTGRTIAYGRPNLGIQCEESLYDMPRVYFTAEFLCRPTNDWIIDWTGAVCGRCRAAQGWCHDGCLVGVLVKCTDPQRVWRLTGNYDMPGHGYEGMWPD